MHPDLNADRLVTYPSEDRTNPAPCVSDDVLSELYWKLSPKTLKDRWNIQIYYSVIKGSGEYHASSSDNDGLEDPNGILQRMAALYGKKWQKVEFGTTTSWMINPMQPSDPTI